MNITLPIFSLQKGRLIVSRPPALNYSIKFQYNPEKISRSVVAQTVVLSSERRSQAPSYRGAAKETISLEARFEAIPALTDDQVRNGVLPEIAALELLLYPTSDEVRAENARLDKGSRTLSAFPIPRVNLEWGQRSLPVMLTQMTIDEQQFDDRLNPVRAVVNLSFEVLTYSTLSDEDTQADKFLEYQKQLELLSRTAVAP